MENNCYQRWINEMYNVNSWSSYFVLFQICEVAVGNLPDSYRCPTVWVSGTETAIRLAAYIANKFPHTFDSFEWGDFLITLGQQICCTIF